MDAYIVRHLHRLTAPEPPVRLCRLEVAYLYHAPERLFHPRQICPVLQATLGAI